MPQLLLFQEKAERCRKKGLQPSGKQRAEFVHRHKQFRKLLSKKHIFISNIIVNTRGLRYL
jgi:hypothetical protein